MSVENTLQDRGTTHGNFTDNSEISQDLKTIISRHGDKLSPMMREAIDMICHKIGRICAGDPTFKDHWHDIAGYATLVEERL